MASVDSVTSRYVVPATVPKSNEDTSIAREESDCNRDPICTVCKNLLTEENEFGGHVASVLEYEANVSGEYVAPVVDPELEAVEESGRSVGVESICWLVIVSEE